MKKDVCIIIPYIDLANYVLMAVDSIRTKYSYHIFLIDNNSSKETKLELRHLTKRKDLTIIYNDSNVGCAGSWNQGIKMSLENYDPDYIVVLNNDIILHPAAIDNMIKVIKNEGHALVSAFDSCRECEIPMRIKVLPIPVRHFLVDYPEFSCYTLNVSAINKLAEFEKGVHEYPGLFDQKFYPAYFEDNDFHYRLKLNKMRAVKTNSALYYHFGSRTIKENKDVGIISNTYFLTNKQYYIEKWGGKPGHELYKTPFNN